jgi:anti-sigma regulatory factor (Ser/Thr protein kinase)
MTVRLELASDGSAPAHARTALAPLSGHVDEDVLERARLLTSEVVTNSVRHADGAEVRVEIWPAGGSIAVVVSDDGSGFSPAAQPAAMAGGGGFGLPLVDTLAEAWGSGCDGEAWVWFEVWPRAIEALPPTPGGRVTNP